MAIFTLINEINKKGKSLLQHLEVQLRKKNNSVVHSFQSPIENSHSMFENSLELAVLLGPSLGHSPSSLSGCYASGNMRKRTGLGLVADIFLE